MSSQVGKGQLDAVGRQYEPTLPPIAFARRQRLVEVVWAWDAVPEQSWQFMSVGQGGTSECSLHRDLPVARAARRQSVAYSPSPRL